MAFDIGKISFGTTNFGSTAVGSGATALVSGNKAGYDSGGFGATMTGLKMVPVYGQALALVEGIIGKTTINETLGAIFAKGGGISCWGSSWTPAKAESEVPQHATFVVEAFKKALNVTPDRLQSSLNNFFKDGWKAGQLYPSKAYWWLNSGAKDCTKRGLERYKEGMDGVLEQCFQAARAAAKKAGFDIVKSGTAKCTVGDERGRTATISVMQVLVKFPVPQAKPVVQTATKPKAPVLGAPVASKTAVPSSDNAPTKGGAAMFPVALLAAGAFFILKKKKK